MKFFQNFNAFLSSILFWFKRNIKFLVLALVAIVLFIFALLYRTQSSGPVTVSGFFPSNGALNVERNTNIDIYFKYKVPEKERSAFYIRFMPGVTFESKWISPTQLQIKPTSPLSSGLSYRISINYKDAPLTGFNFTVKRELAEIQIEDVSEEDLKWMNDSAQTVNDSIDALRETYFWYFDLPVLTEKYALLFDNKKNQFRVSLFTKTGMSEEEKKQLLDEAVARLTSIVDTDAIKYGYYVIYRENYVPPLNYNN